MVVPVPFRHDGTGGSHDSVDDFLYTATVTPVAAAHVPVVSLLLAAILNPIRILHRLAPVGAPTSVHPDGNEGLVTDPSRKANATIKSPAACVGIATVLAAADASLT